MKEREIAYQNLCQIIIDGKYSNLVLRSGKKTSPFITQLVYGTLRNYRLVREAWSRYAERKLPERVAILLDGDSLFVYVFIERTADSPVVWHFDFFPFAVIEAYL